MTKEIQEFERLKKLYNSGEVLLLDADDLYNIVIGSGLVAKDTVDLALAVVKAPPFDTLSDIIYFKTGQVNAGPLLAEAYAGLQLTEATQVSNVQRVTCYPQNKPRPKKTTKKTPKKQTLITCSEIGGLQFDEFFSRNTTRKHLARFFR